MNYQEDHEQIAFFDWVALQLLGNKPLSDVCWATPNGGRRRLLEARRMKRQGVKAGVFDITLAVACGGYHGLFIEMKAGDNTMSDEQHSFKKAVTSEGYLCVTCYSAEDAIDEVKLYLAGAKAPPVAYIRELNTQPKYLAVCRRMSAKFKTKRGAIGWLERRGFDEQGKRI